MKPQRRRPILATRTVTFALLCCSQSYRLVQAFSPISPVAVGRPSLHTAESADTRRPTKTQRFVLHDPLERANLGNDFDDDGGSSGAAATTSTSSRLHLQFQKGKLTLFDMETGEPQTLLQGINSDTWTATRPSSADDASIGTDDDVLNSLFLHIHQSHGDNNRASGQVHSSMDPGKTFSLGNLIACDRVLSCSRLTQYWMGPAFGSCVSDGVPVDTQFMLVQLDGDTDGGAPNYALFLPLLDDGFRTSLEPGRENDGEARNHVDVLVQSIDGNDDRPLRDGGIRALHVSVSSDPFELLKRAFQQVSQATGTFRTLDQKQVPNSVNEFGWCTWDAFYSKVTPEGVLQGVSDLRKDGIQVRNVILDDGWQQVDPAPADWLQANGKPDGKETPEDSAEAEAECLSPLVGLLLGVVTNVVTAFYESMVRRAPFTAGSSRLFRVLSLTVLKDAWWHYFQDNTDFARQISAFTPNAKFQLPGTEEDGIEGLKQLVSTLKSDEYGIHSVYCWHALHGYWRGVSPALGARLGINVTDIVPNPNANLLRIEPQLAWCPITLFGVGLVPTSAELAILYQNLHEPLVQAGVDGVKVDVQSGVSAVGSGIQGASQLSRQYTEAMEASVAERFAEPKEDTTESAAINTINCMCHSTENLYRYQVTSVARASEDFFPRRQESHTVHLINVAYNSLFIGEICLPDWDMFHSLHDSAALHAAARAIGGCPVYVSDEPGKHDAELLQKLVLPDGSLLRARLPGRPTRDCLFADVGKDGKTALKIWNENEFGGVVGAFHVQGVAWNYESNENEVLDTNPTPLAAQVRPVDVEGLRSAEGPFVAWGHQSKKLHWLPTRYSSVKSELKHREWELFTIAPVMRQLTNDGRAVAWAPIGLADMYNSGGAIQSVGPLEQARRGGGYSVRTQFTSRGPGRFVAACQPCPSRVLIRRGDGSIRDLLFEYNEVDEAQNGLLSVTLPEEVPGGAPHDVTVVWE